MFAPIWKSINSIRFSTIRHVLLKDNCELCFWRICEETISEYVRQHSEYLHVLSKILTIYCTLNSSRFSKGTRIVQADSGFDSDSESRRQSAQRMPFISAGAYSGGRRRRVGADSLRQTVYRNDFLIPVPTLGIGVGNWICLRYTRTLSLYNDCNMTVWFWKVQNKRRKD
jgi:hypothetical protein